MYSAQQRVEFFQSESDFGSESSLNNSRFYDFTNDIIAQTDNLFLTLKKQLKPNQKLSQQQKVKYVLSRAQILCKDTIPEHLTYLNKIGAPNNARSQIMVCSEKLNKLLSDYESLRNNTMIYKQFFNIYGKEFGYSPEASFVKGQRVLCVEDENEAVLKPECIQINYNNSNAKLRATPRVFMAANPPSSDKEVAGLKEQIYLLKKSIEQMKKNYDVEITNQKLLTEKRIQTYLRAQSFNDYDLQKLKNEVQQYSFKLSCSEEQNAKLKVRIDEYQKAVQLLQSKNQSLQNEVTMLRKRDINIEEDDIHNRSYTSEMNEKEEKKTEKKIKILIHENELLKSQLKAERQKLYRVSSDLTNEEKGELERLKKQVQQKKSQLEQLYSTLDKQRIELLQVSHNNKALTKMNQSLKQQSQQMKKQMKNVGRQSAVNLYPLPSVPQIDSSMVQSRKLQVSEYEGQGIEGLPYYEILNKQFKIRFRRSCLKDKELLHKSNGLELGVISKFEKPNKIDILLHISNYGEFAFKKVKGKVLNANDNKIGGDVFQYPEIAQGDQVKVPVSLLINNYPLGPLILALQYQSEKREEFRILLPAHIFKMMEFDERTEPLKHPEKISITTERKISKNLEDLRGYFKAGRIQDGRLQLSAFHRHTHTQVHLNIVQTKDGLELHYNHYQGKATITEYFIRTLVFLIKK